MSDNKNLIAIGRSRYLYDSIKYLLSQGFSFKAIITETAYQEYGITHYDFEELAKELGIPFFMTKTPYSAEIINLVKQNKVRAAISANWKYTLPKDFLDLFECGVLNFHLGNLPDYKGNATVNWSIINGEKFINGNIHKMDPLLDAGDIVSVESIPIESNTYIGEVIEKAENIAPYLYANAVKKVLESPNAYVIKGTERGLRCYPRLPEDSQINWNQGVEEIYRLIRASASPYTGAYSFLKGEKVVIWKATPYHTVDKFLVTPGHVVNINKETGSILVACKDALLEVQEIQCGSQRMVPADYIKSIRVRFKFIADEA